MTKCTGIIRRIDDIGRIVIPKEVRRALRIKERDAFVISVTENGVLFEKYDANAEITGSLEKIINDFGDEVTEEEIKDICKVIKSIYLRNKEE